MNSITYRQALKHLQGLLIEKYENSYTVSLALLSYISKSSTTEVLSSMDNFLSQDCLNVYEDVCEKINTDIPISYIIHNIDFYNESYYIDENVLIPRPESELLIDMALKFLSTLPRSNCLEIGTGSGCLSISILNNTTSQLSIVATDISEPALAVARKNAALILPKNKRIYLSFKQEDLLIKSPEGKFDLIISNPPYIPQQEYDDLPKSLHYEPRIALTDQNDGLNFYRELAKIATDNLAPNGKMLLEIHSEMAQEVKTIFSEMGTLAQIHKDAFGRDRVIDITSKDL